MDRAESNAVIECLPRLGNLEALTTELQLLVGRDVRQELVDVLPSNVKKVEYVDLKDRQVGSGGGTWFEHHWPILLRQITEVVRATRRQELKAGEGKFGERARRDNEHQDQGQGDQVFGGRSPIWRPWVKSCWGWWLGSGTPFWRLKTIERLFERGYWMLVERRVSR